MKFQWLLIFACLLITACNQTPNEGVPGTPTSTATPGTSAEPADMPTEGAALKREPLSPEARFSGAQRKYKTAVEQFVNEYEAAEDADRAALAKEKFPKAEDYAEEFMNIAVDHPRSEVAFDSLCWIVSNARAGDISDKAFELLFANYIEKEALKDICMSLSYGDPGPQVESRLNQLIDSSPHDSVKAAATFALASYFSRLPQTRQFVASHPEQVGFSPASVKYLNEREVSPMTIEALHQTLISDFPDLKPRQGSKRTYRAMAEQSLFELNNLAIGKIAPEIEGDDLDGVTFKLSDYRGKVVVLDFWGDW